MLDENEFLSPYGIRSLSQFHQHHPYVFNVKGQEFKVGYLPAESDTGMFGGNSNWRGPVWMPVNGLMIRALLNFYLFYGDNFQIECPTGSGRMMNLFEVAKEISDRLTAHLPPRRSTAAGPSIGGYREVPDRSPLARSHSLLRVLPRRQRRGFGASHQTGWTGIVAKLIQLFATLDPKRFLEAGKAGAFAGEASGG